jgi:hypothetical protein
VGWFSTDGDGHFVPALRTAVGEGARWRLYAGAGIVEGSTAQGEWDETGIKFQPILRALASRGATFPDADLPGTTREPPESPRPDSPGSGSRLP